MKKQYGFCRTALLLCAWLFSTAIYAKIEKGVCGADLTWTLNTETGVLEISGMGEMFDYQYVAPWYMTGVNTVVIGEGVTSIGDHAFYKCEGLTSITIPNSVTTIGWEAFSGCTSLTAIIIPESVNSIDKYTFNDCINLEKFEGKFASSDHRCLIVNDTLIAFAPSGLTEYTIPNEVTTIGDWAFSECHNLTSITMGNSVTTIGLAAFRNCDGLTSITISNSVTIIDHEAFCGCKSLTEIAIPQSATFISDVAFLDCDGLEKFEGKFASSDHRCLVVNDTLIAFAPSGLTRYSIPENVTTIGTIVFGAGQGCNLVEITIPRSVTSIARRAFHNCPHLKTVWFNADSCITAEDESYYDDGIFMESLTTLHIGKNVKQIPERAFSYCKGLTEITIPNSVTIIGEKAFLHCIGLTSVAIGDGVTTIGNNAFFGCSGLTAITMPERVTTIGDDAFCLCTGLTSVTAYNPIPVDIVTDEWWSLFAFYGVDCANCTLYVPAESVEKYKAAEGWSEFGEILPIDESSAITETRQEQADGHITVYNLQGVLVLETDDAADLKTLQNGAYIVNGKKMIIVR